VIFAGNVPITRATSFAVIPGGHLEQDTSYGVGKLEKRPRDDRAMTDLSRAFALDIDFDIDQAQAEAKWPLGRTLAFAIVLSAALWILITGAIYIT
jgi:hypothetical protein